MQAKANLILNPPSFSKQAKLATITNLHERQAKNSGAPYPLAKKKLASRQSSAAPLEGLKLSRRPDRVTHGPRQGIRLESQRVHLRRTCRHVDGARVAQRSNPIGLLGNGVDRHCIFVKDVRVRRCKTLKIYM